jgi:hypothetical protein
MRYALTSLFTLLTIALFAQTGTISGKVINEKTGEVLSGASVTLTPGNKKTASDQTGVFTFRNLTPGSYSVTISYVGLNTKEIAEILVKNGEIADVNAALAAKESTLQNVVVRSTVSRENQTALLITQKNSPVVSDGISAEIIRKTPDRNTSDVLKRVSGASIQDDRFVVIRGLNERYNAAYLNGAPLPSSESDRKAFAFDIFPSSILDNLVIYKTAAPDMPAEFAGGLINITTKSIPAKNFTTISVGLGYNTISTFKDRLTYKGGKWDFVGVDDGTRAIPSQIPSIKEFNTLLPAQRAEYSKYFANNWAINKKQTLPYGSFQFSKGVNFQRKGKDFAGVLLSLTYSNNTLQTQGERNIFDYDRSAAAEAPQWKDRYNDRIYTTQTLMGALANFSFKLGDNSSINFKNILSINSDNRVVDRTGTPDYVGDPTFVANIRGRVFTSNLIYSTQLGGNHIISKSKARLEWLGAYSVVNRSIPDTRQSIYFASDGGDLYADVATGRPVPDNGGTHFYSKTKEHIVSGKVDFTQPFLLGKVQSQLKAGVYYQQRSRTFDARLLAFTAYGSGGTNFDYSLLTLPEATIFAPQNLGGDLGNGRGGFALGDGTQPTYVYDATSNLGAGYIMLDQRFGRKVRLVYGARAEDFQQQLNSTNSFFEPLNINTTKLDVLPSANVIFSVTPKQNIRLAYSKTLNRPEFRELAPFVFFDFVTRYTIEGDTSLQRSTINNYDLRYEFFPGKSQLFSVSGFFKDFTNPIELVSNPNGSRSAVYKNARSANIFGIETEFRTLIGPLVRASEKSFLNDITWSANLAFLWSNIKLNDFGQIGVKDLNSNRSLQGQSPYVFNTGLTYSNTKAGITATFSANRVGDRIYIVGTKNDADIYERGRTVTDFQFTKNLHNDAWELKLNVKDLLAQKQVFYYDIDSNKKFSGTSDRIFSRNTFGRVISLTATCKF